MANHRIMNTKKQKATSKLIVHGVWMFIHNVHYGFPLVHGCSWCSTVQLDTDGSLQPEWLQDHQCSYAHSREEQLGEHNLNPPPHYKHL